MYMYTIVDELKTRTHRGGLLVRTHVPHSVFGVAVERVVPVLDSRPDCRVREQDGEEDEQVLVHASDGRKGWQ